MECLRTRSQGTISWGGGSHALSLSDFTQVERAILRLRTSRSKCSRTTTIGLDQALVRRNVPVWEGA